MCVCAHTHACNFIKIKVQISTRENHVRQADRQQLTPFMYKEIK